MNATNHIEKLRKDIAKNDEEIKTLQAELDRHTLEISAIEIKVRTLQSLIELKEDGQKQMLEIIGKYELLQAQAN